MPYTTRYVSNIVGNKLIYAQRNYNKPELATEFKTLFESLTSYITTCHCRIFIYGFLKDKLFIYFYLNITKEQRKTYDTIMNAISIQFGQMFFLYGYGGTNKKFMWRTLSVTLRLQGHIVLNVASNGMRLCCC